MDLPVMVELESLGGAATSTESAYVDTRSRRSASAAPGPDEAGREGWRRSSILMAAFVAVAAVAAMFAWLSGGSGDNAAATPTTAPATNSGAPTSTSPMDTRPPRVEPSTARSTPPEATTRPATTIPYIAQRMGAVLDDTQNAYSLYVHDGGLIRRVELGTGEVSVVEPGDEIGSFFVEGLTADGLILNAFDGTYRMLARDFVGGPVPMDLPEGAQSLYVTPHGGVVLVSQLDGGPAGDDPELALLLRSADVEATWNLDSGVLVQMAGRLWTVDRGTVTPVANGDMVATNGREVVWYGCDDALRCEYHLRTADGNDRIVPIKGAITGDVVPSLSPDGGRLFAMLANRQLGVVDLVTGETRATAIQVGVTPTWSPDGTYHFEVGPSDEIVATNLVTGRRTTLDFDLITASGTSVLFVG